MKKVNIVIDGQKVQVPADYTVINAAKELNIDIPALCYDPNLEIVSSCRLCIVEIEGSNKLQTSCSTIVREGMVVKSQSEKLSEARKGILQLLLDSHPNDCLTCQKAGECLLQKYSYEYDVQFKTHEGAMRPVLSDTSSPYILRDSSKCILCGKCVRTCGQIDERQILSFSERGYDTKIIFGADQTIEESYCVSCNRCVVVCPVGALVDKRLVGKLRSWEGESTVVNCKACQYGCEFDVLSKNNKKIAVRAKEPTNGRPLCLKGRLTTELINVDNPDTPYRKVGDKFVETTWTGALGIEEALEKIAKLENND